MNQKGFSLVELAIVMVVIGLLVGGVLKGQELIQIGRVTNLIKQVNAYQVAIRTFDSSYGDLPGDISNPAARVPNCSTAPCTNGGDANGLIGAEHFSAHSSYDTPIETGATAENRTFWLHLMKAGLISGIIENYSGTPNTAGTDFPAGPYNSGFQITRWRNSDSRWHVRRGHHLVLAKRIGVSIANTANTPAYPMIMAAQFDQKMDDGKPVNGNIEVTSECGGSYNTNVYNIASTDNCSQLIYLGF